MEHLMVKMLIIQYFKCGWADYFFFLRESKGKNAFSLSFYSFPPSIWGFYEGKSIICF